MYWNVIKLFFFYEARKQIRFLQFQCSESSLLVLQYNAQISVKKFQTSKNLFSSGLIFLIFFILGPQIVKKAEFLLIA